MTLLQSQTQTTASLQHRLEGGWQVCPVPLNSTEVPITAEWTSIPDSTHLQLAMYPDNPYWGEHLRPINEQAWVYQRSFTVPAVPYQRARLRFEAVDYYASVWVNGQHAGEHEGNFAPFDLDITPFIQPDSENVLTVRVSAPWDAPNAGGTYPVDHVIRGLVKGLYEHGEGVIPPDVNPIGIWRPVWLLLDDGISIDQLRITTALDGQVNVDVTVANSTQRAWAGVMALDVAAENHGGSGASVQTAVTLLPGTQVIKQTLKLDDPQLWWPWDHGAPNLYRLEAELRDEDGPTSQHSAVFGVRTVRLERTAQRFTYFINERPVFLRGSSYVPALYLSQCESEGLRRDIEWARGANLNLLRLHVHVSHPAVYDLCNRSGMLIWQDFELNWIQERTPDFERRARAIQRDMIDLLGNHPAIISWVCHNEPTMVFTRRHNFEQRPDPALYADARQQDPTRPVFICSGQMEDDWQRAGDVHSYYGSIWTARYTDMYRHDFRLNTEFGFETPAAAATLRQYPDVWERLSHLEDQIETLWEYQAELIQYQVEHLRRLRATACAGYIHFWLKDTVPQVGCGVLDSNCLPKGGYDALRRASQPLHVALEHDGKRPYALWVYNDTPQAYADVTVRCTVRDENGSSLFKQDYPCHIRANASQRIATADWGMVARQADRVELALCGADGGVLAENFYAHPFQPTLRPRGYPWKFDPFLGTKVFDRAGAPSLADHNINRLFKLVPLVLRHQIAEWAMRQKLPLWLLSSIARFSDYFS